MFKSARLFIRKKERLWQRLVYLQRLQQNFPVHRRGFRVKTLQDEPSAFPVEEGEHIRTAAALQDAVCSLFRLFISHFWRVIAVKRWKHVSKLLLIFSNIHGDQYQTCWVLDIIRSEGSLLTNKVECIVNVGVKVKALF